MQVNSNVDSVHWSIKYTFALLVCSALVLPASGFFGVPVKHLAYISCAGIVFYYWLNGRVINRHIFALFVSSALFVTVFMAIGVFNGVAAVGYVVLEGSGFFTAITVVLLLLAAKDFGLINTEELMAYFFWGGFLFSLWKVAVVLAMVSGLVTYDTVFYFFMDHIGYRPVASGIFGGLVRFNFIIFDFVVAFLLFLVPAYPDVFCRVPKLFRSLFMVIGLACLVFAFSRLLFVLVAVLWAYVFFTKMQNLSRLIVVFLFSGVVVASLPWLEGAYEQRFHNVQNSKSDDIRVEQVEALLNAWTDAPVVGGGFGFYAKDLIRDPSAPFSYEVQWIGFVAKLGFLGVSYLIFLVFLMFSSVLKAPRTLDHFVLAFVLASFVLGGFTNQYLINSTSGVFYVVHIVLSEYLRSRARDPKRLSV